VAWAIQKQEKNENGGKNRKKGGGRNADTPFAGAGYLMKPKMHNPSRENGIILYDDPDRKLKEERIREVTEFTKRRPAKTKGVNQFHSTMRPRRRKGDFSLVLRRSQRVT